jgi:predicted RND superfamily exporter protein
MYKRLARFTLLIIGILSLIFLYAASQLKFDYNFENFFPTGDEDLEFFLNYREQFANDNDYLLIGIRNNSGIFQKDFLQKIDAITRQLDSLELTQQVISITNLSNPVLGPLGILQPPVLHINKAQTYEKDSLQIYHNPTIRGTLVAEDIPAISILINHQQQISKKNADLLMQQVSNILSSYHFDAIHIAGKAKAQAVYIEKMQEELVTFVGASVILVIIFLSIAYRSFWGVWVPLLVVMLTAVWITGIMSLTGKMLDVMLVLLPTIMFVVGMSDVVHILTKYIEELRNGSNKIKAIKTTMREVGLATFLTSLTTAVGFLTLLTANVQPIREFGIYTALGVFVAFMLAFTLLPAIMVLMKKPEVVYRKENKLLWVSKLRYLLIWVLRNRRSVLLLSTIVILFSVYGISKIQINTFLLEDIRDNDPLKQDFLFFDQHFGGSKPFEMAIMVKDSTYSLYDPEVLQEIDKMENYLRQDYGVDNILSPLLLSKSINKALNGGLQEYFRLPEQERDYKRIHQALLRISKSPIDLPVAARQNMPGHIDLGRNYLEQLDLGRISGKMGDIGSRLTKEKNAEMEQFIENEINTDLVDFRLTGTSMLIDKNAEFLIQNMLHGLGIAFLVVAVIAGLLFRSFRMILVTLIPNLIPLLMIAGMMGYFGIYMKLSTSIIFTIAFGIAVDDTIHFISKLKIELNKGKSFLYAVKNTYIYTGKAIIITTLILAGGFLTLILSTFGGTFYTGLLVSLTLVFAVVADLTLLPVLLILILHKPAKNHSEKTDKL